MIRFLALAGFVTGCGPSFPSVELEDCDCDTGEVADTGDTSADADTDTDSGSDTGSGDTADTSGDTADTGSGDTADTSGDTADTAVDTGDEPVVDAWEGYISISGSQVCLSSSGFEAVYSSAPAYVVGYGGSLDWTIQESLEISPASSVYCIETADWALDEYILTLMSSLQSDGSATTSYANTGDWWNNDVFCNDTDSATAALYCQSQGWVDEDGDGDPDYENFLVAFTKDMTGLSPSGDGS